MCTKECINSSLCRSGRAFYNKVLKHFTEVISSVKPTLELADSLWEGFTNISNKADILGTATQKVELLDAPKKRPGDVSREGCNK